MRALAYNITMADAWNTYVGRSKNGTFLFNRQFMDYHAHRFRDASLVFVDDNGGIRGLLPANYDGERRRVVSHGGLTYGGLVLDSKAVQTSANEMLALAAMHYVSEYGAESLVYKPVPHIYHSLPAEEDLYALFRAGASLAARCVSSALCPASHPKQRQSRRGGVVRAIKSGMTVEEITDAGGAELRAFHSMLEEILKARHQARPVHSYEEMKMLTERFPDNIKMFVTRHEGAVIAGSWVFVTPRAVHTQYLATTDEGKRLGAEDLLIDWLISERFAAAPWFDFGISTENGGALLNKGLIFEKEGFGARSVCYDTYVLDLNTACEKLKELV